LGLIEG
jgi:hypothetical protein